MNTQGNLLILLSTFIVISGYELTILHTNDVHARFEQFNKYGSDCHEEDARDGKCFGGVARRYTKIQEIRGSHDNVILMDAGDQFTGTPWFSVHRGMATSYFMKKLEYDVMCLGNHEFDNGVEGLETFLDNVTFPVISANTDVTNEPRMQGKFGKSWTVTLGGEQIGVIGYITPETAQISKPGPTISFRDVLSAVRDELAVLQGQGINKIIALGHAGFNMDKQVAAIDGIDIVIGGHTNTFLYNGVQPSREEIEGPYPVVVYQTGRDKGLVVQDYQMAKYLGYLNVTFDANGMITEYSGKPILLNSSVIEDTQILQYISEWKKPVEELSEHTIGYSKVLLDDSCSLYECNLGNLVTDAIIEYHVNYSHPETYWAPACIAVWNGGGIRASIDKGVVSVGEAISAMPFENEVDVVTVKGKNIRDQLELSVRDWDPKVKHGRFLQMSGLHVVYNLQQPAGQRVVSVEARCLECDIPSYSPLKDNDDFNVFLSTFLINGGDGYSFEPSRHQRFNTLDVTTLIDYIKKHSPVFATVEGRIRFQEDSISGSTKLSANTLMLFIKLVMAMYIIT